MHKPIPRADLLEIMDSSDRSKIQHRAQSRKIAGEGWRAYRELRARIGVQPLSGQATMIFMSSPHPVSAMTPASQIPRLEPEAAWRQLAARDPEASFYYGVVTTGVFCRPSCGSRLPQRANVRFFGTAAEAEAAGFRACKRCRPAVAPRHPLDAVRVHIESNFDRRVGLEELGRVAQMSASTVQRLFKRTMGVSPLQYQRALRAQRMRDALRQGDNVTDAIYNAGFSSSSRAYEASQLGMTPQRFAQGGKGEQIRFISASSRFGWIVAGATERGLCWLSLAATKAGAESSLREEFPLATLRRDRSLSRWVEQAVESVGSGANLPHNQTATELDLRGTVFQLRVWQALKQIPRGETRSYSQLARELGEPKAVRAVARACAVNRVAVLVPCHRVVGASGALTGYRWGVERKRQLLEAERIGGAPGER